MFGNRDEGALAMTAVKESMQKDIDKLKDQLRESHATIDDLNLDIRRKDLEHDFELRDFNAAHDRAIKMLRIDHEKAIQTSTIHGNSESVIARNKLNQMESDGNSALGKLRDEVEDAKAERRWETEKACNKVRRDLEGKCIESDNRRIKAESENAMLREMLKNAKPDTSALEKTLTEAMKVIGKAVEKTEVKITNNVKE